MCKRQSEKIDSVRVTLPLFINRVSLNSEELAKLC